MENAMKSIARKMEKPMKRQTHTLAEALLHVRKVDLVSALSPYDQLNILTKILDIEGTPYYITKAEDGWYLNIDERFRIPVIVLPK